MKKKELQDMGFMESLVITTPNGGDLAEAYFFDEGWNYTTKENSVHMIIKEFKNGVMINETFFEKDYSNLSIQNK